MGIEFDPAKNAKNIATRGLSFDLVAELDFETALVAEDARHQYGETRYTVVGVIRGRVHVAVVTFRGLNVRVISLRRANAREERMYGEASK